MLKNISEKEFIEIIGYRSYLHFCKIYHLIALANGNGVTICF